MKLCVIEYKSVVYFFFLFRRKYLVIVFQMLISHADIEIPFSASAYRYSEDPSCLFQENVYLSLNPALLWHTFIYPEKQSNLHLFLDSFQQRKKHLLFHLFTPRALISLSSLSSILSFFSEEDEEEAQESSSSLQHNRKRLSDYKEAEHFFPVVLPFPMGGPRKDPQRVRHTEGSAVIVIGPPGMPLSFWSWKSF